MTQWRNCPAAATGGRKSATVAWIFTSSRNQATATFRATLDPRIVLERGQGHFNEDSHLTELPSALDAVIS